MPELASVIDAVTVFPDRARVTRRGRTALEPGQHRLEISGLPMSLLADSVRAAGRGTARARLLGVSLQVKHFAATPAHTARELEEKIQASMDADAELAAEAEGLEKARQSLDGLAAQSDVFARGLALRNRSTADQAAIFDFLAERGRALQTDRLAVARKRRELAKEIERLKRELAELQTPYPRQRHTAVVEVDVAAAGEMEVELAYAVQPARWQPLYDLRLTAAGLEVTYLAEVAQSTGEDWAGVALTLSTARPSLALVIPELDPWYVGPRPPAPPKAVYRSAAPAAAAPQAAAFMAQVEEATDLDVTREAELDLELPSATVSESGAALTYQIPSRADVPSGNEPRKVTVGSFKLRPDFDAVTAPRLEPVCYRRARVKNESPYTFLPGRAQLFEDDDYLGTTPLELAAPGREFELALGADERLRVERKLLARDVDKTLLADRRRIRYKYRIEVENLRDAAQVVYVRDQLPVSRHEQVKVKLDGATPQPAKHSDLNQLEWKLNLAPAAKQTVQFEFSVEFPRAMEVVGLV
ncbi:MAG TPA: mucoidy inhibitor MuiA family protein [Thermoanaerobaculia bacterium]